MASEALETMASMGEQLDEVAKLKEQIKQSKALCSQNKEETLRMRQAHVGPSCTLFFKENPLKMVQGRGQYLYDELGNEYLDCINNVAHVGHGNARLAAAVGRQLGLLNTNSRFLHESLSLYAKRLTATFPAHLSVCYLVNSGSEANDLAMRLARAHTRRKDIVSLEGAYHGNLTSTMAISPYKTAKLADFKQPKWAHVAPLPCLYRGLHARTLGAGAGAAALREEEERLGVLYAHEARLVVERAQAAGRQVAALFVESMISCGGQTPLPASYLRHLQQFLRQNNSLLVCDEVQTGFGRCGKHMWAFQLGGADVKPDIVTLGKPMGNGFPISAVVTTPEIAQSFLAIGTEYFNTFGGNPASCAAALAVLDELEGGALMGRAEELGRFLLGELRQLQRNSRVMGDVRGAGLFIGVDIVENLSSKRAAPGYAQFLVERFRDERILMSTEGKLGNVLKFKPPMVFSMADARRFVRVLVGALAELERRIDAAAAPPIAGGQLQLQQQPAAAMRLTSASSSCSSSSSSSWLESSSELE